MSTPIPFANQFRTQALVAPFLEREEERQLILNVQLHDCITSAKQLAESHFRFVASVARRFAKFGVDVEDLIQQGCIGLLRAIKAFDINRHDEVRFITYATLYIKAEIINYVLDNVRSYRIATSKAQRKLFFNLNKYRDANRGQLTPADVKLIAQELNVSEKDVLLMEGKLRGADLSIDDEDNALLEHSLATTKTDPARMVEEEQWEEVTRERIKEAVDSLSERERDVFYHRVVAEDKKTLAELAEEQGCSAERVRQVEIRATKKVREFIERFA